MTYLWHLVRRFLGSLWPGGPAPGDEAWAEAALVPGEVALWRRMSGADRRHAVGVARRAAAELGAEAGEAGEAAVTRPVLAAALLHDVGKVSSGLGPVRRSLATVLSWVVGRDRLAAGDGRFARYLRHDALGADLLADAGSDPLTVTWAREHHLPEPRWTLPPPIAHALKSADDD
jgi:hypothetical protein